jgi:hypothetical protein
VHSYQAPVDQLIAATLPAIKHPHKLITLARIPLPVPSIVQQWITHVRCSEFENRIYSFACFVAGNAGEQASGHAVMRNVVETV